MSSEFTPFVAASMREMLLDMLEKHPEIFDRPTRYPEAMCLHFADMIATHYDEVPF